MLNGLPKLSWEESLALMSIDPTILDDLFRPTDGRRGLLGMLYEVIAAIRDVLFARFQTKNFSQLLVEYLKNPVEELSKLPSCLKCSKPQSMSNQELAIRILRAVCYCRNDEQHALFVLKADLFGASLGTRSMMTDVLILYGEIRTWAQQTSTLSCEFK